MTRRRVKGQISLEFLLIFGLLTILLLYSIRNTSFSEGSPSVENLRIQIALEEKSLANAISNTISQVYAQGPGSKATTYVALTYLRNPSYLEKGLDVTDPQIFITYGPLGGRGDGTYVGIINGTGTAILYTEGDDKNVVWSMGIYSRDLSTNTSVWGVPSEAKIVIGGVPFVFKGLSISPDQLNSTLKIVVEWNPDRGDSWFYNTTAKELRININPGG
ncbi:class III signal peptide-containing protein [Thermococcus sp. 21S7]|nr:class III signal peptide-containing protein [Thermococcus sp. 21S7]